ncbi:MAG: trehalose-phosphatase [Nitriliruptoraceae bacterium]|nr:trehalose-phosphatase [Nitriliruptoraceae bacterium]
MTTHGSPPATDPAELALALGPAASRLLILDFDGVLSPLSDRPEDARPSPGVLDTLRVLSGLTEVAVISGRPLADLGPRLTGLELTLGGAHGAELQHRDGRHVHVVDVGAVREPLDTVGDAVEEVIGDASGWLLERKPTALAIHHRLADADDVAQRLPRLEAILEHHTGLAPGFETLHGRSVLEFRPTGADKGEALRTLAAEHPGRAPLVLGDDRTDEDAFDAAIALDGDAVLVAEEPRPTAARHRLTDPDAVVTFLDALGRSEP